MLNGSVFTVIKRQKSKATHNTKTLLSWGKHLCAVLDAVALVTAGWVDVSCLDVDLSCVILSVEPKQEKLHFSTTETLSLREDKSHMMSLFLLIVKDLCLSHSIHKHSLIWTALGFPTSQQKERRREIWGHVSNWAAQSEVCLHKLLVECVQVGYICVSASPSICNMRRSVIHILLEFITNSHQLISAAWPLLFLFSAFYVPHVNLCFFF